MQSQLIEFKPGNRYFESQARITQAISWVTVAVNLLIIVASPRDPGNIYWFLLGSSFGLALIFKGSLGLLPHRSSYTRTGVYLHEQFEMWFPLFQFWLRYIFVILCLTAFWLQLLSQGLSVSISMNICLAGVLLLLPCDWLLLEKSRHATSPKWYRLHEMTRFLITFAICVIVGLVAQDFLPTPEETMTRQVPLRVVLIWTPISLIILSNLIVLLGRIRKAGEKN
jgi:hypothetical protein